ncbi:MAG: hypothetical protein AAFP98_11440 [Pseudomonadota bacterium]
MGRNWIIDVLADLHTFAARNELPLLANELEKVKTVAVVEIGTSGGDATVVAWGDDADSQRILPQAGNG